MLNLLKHAGSIGPTLAASICELERRCLAWESVANCNADQISSAIIDTWQMVIIDVKSCQFDLTIPYISRLHKHLADLAGADAPGQFVDAGSKGTEWNTTVSSLLDICEGFDYSYFADAVVLSQLCWGGHVQSMAFSLGWLCMNGLHLRESIWAIYPPLDDHERLLEYLSYAGPDCWDAESLRALLGEYTDEQDPAKCSWSM